VQIEITLQDGVPIYRQIVNQVKYQIASGRLSTDEELPAIRALAQRLSITPNTVVKAYSTLENEGLVYKKQGAGTYVADTKSPLAKKEQRRLLTQRADALLTEASQFGFAFDEVVELLKKRQDAINKGTKKG
jgi:GntR family transcriptional regulator